MSATQEHQLSTSPSGKSPVGAHKPEWAFIKQADPGSWSL